MNSLSDKDLAWLLYRIRDYSRGDTDALLDEAASCIEGLWKKKDELLGWVKRVAKHPDWCKAKKGSPDEGWLIEEECDCGLTDLKRKHGIKLLGE